MPRVSPHFYRRAPVVCLALLGVSACGPAAARPPPIADSTYNDVLIDVDPLNLGTWSRAGSRQAASAFATRGIRRRGRPDQHKLSLRPRLARKVPHRTPCRASGFRRVRSDRGTRLPRRARGGCRWFFGSRIAIVSHDR